MEPAPSDSTPGIERLAYVAFQRFHQVLKKTKHKTTTNINVYNYKIQMNN